MAHILTKSQGATFWKNTKAGGSIYKSTDIKSKLYILPNGLVTGFCLFFEEGGKICCFYTKGREPTRPISFKMEIPLFMNGRPLIEVSFTGAIYSDESVITAGWP
jgi:hypothetical protein